MISLHKHFRSSRSRKHLMWLETVLSFCRLFYPPHRNRMLYRKKKGRPSSRQKRRMKCVKDTALYDFVKAASTTKRFVCLSYSRKLTTLAVSHPDKVPTLVKTFSKDEPMDTIIQNLKECVSENNIEGIVIGNCLRIEFSHIPKYNQKCVDLVKCISRDKMFQDLKYTCWISKLPHALVLRNGGCILEYQRLVEEREKFAAVGLLQDDLTTTLFQQCRQSQFTIQRMIETTGDNEALLFEALNVNDEIQKVLTKYKDLKKPFAVHTEPEPAMIPVAVEPDESPRLGKEDSLIRKPSGSRGVACGVEDDDMMDDLDEMIFGRKSGATSDGAQTPKTPKKRSSKNDLISF